MKQHSRIFTCVAIILFSVFPFANSGHAQGRCIIASDIHFNPFYGGISYEKLKYLDDWEKVFRTDSAQKNLPYGTYKGDSNYALLMAAIRNMSSHFSENHPPDFIVIAGDFLWHEESTPPGISPDTLKALKTRSLQFIAGLFAKEFKGVPVIPALGNNDSDRGDYIKQSSEFLKAFAEAWKLTGLGVSPGAFENGKGYYAAHIKKYPDLKFIVLNSTLVSDARNRDNEPEDHKNYAEGSDMLDELNAELKEDAKKVWIVSHMPAGRNGYAYIRNKPTKDMWNYAYGQRFGNIVKTNMSKIKFSVAGHTHFNEYRVLCDSPGEKPFAWIRIVPSVTTQHVYHSSYEIADFDKDYNVARETVYFGRINGKVSVWDSLPPKPCPQLATVTPQSLFNYFKEFDTVKPPVVTGNYADFYYVGENMPLDGWYLKADILKVGPPEK